MDKEEKEKVKGRIEEVMSRILSNKYDAKIKIKFVPVDKHKKNKK